MDQPNEPTLTLQDIADLAKVERAVVSMWRKRESVRGQLVPFPQPITEVNGLVRFDRSEVVDYLERTGRGNNAEARLDAATAGPPEGWSLEDLVTLLCLRHLAGDLTHLTDDECAEVAAELDPADESFAGEIAALGDTAEARVFIDGLMAASYGGKDALTKLESSRVGRELALRDLTPHAIELLGTIVDACRTELGADGVHLVSGGDAPTVVLALSDMDPELEVHTFGDGPAARALRRRMVIREQEQAIEFGPRVRLLSVVGIESAQALDDVDDVLLGLEHDEIAVIIGSAAALCDAIPRAGKRQDSLEGKRAQTLGSGGLMAAFKLPRGLWKQAHRQALGVWVFHGSAKTGLPTVADLGTIRPTDLDHDALAADLAAAFGDRADRDARAYRYGKEVALSDIRAGHAVVAPGALAVRVRAPETVDDLNRVYSATLVTAEPDPGFDVRAVHAAGSREIAQRPLSELSRLGLIHLRTGNRIDPSHGDPNGTVSVLSAHEGAEPFRLDPLDAQRLYPRANRTEPGDVVFDHHPPRAIVDPTGGSRVMSPSRILRLTPDAGIGPYAVAALINDQPAHNTDWRTWIVPRLPAEESERLESVLAEAADYTMHLRTRQDAMEDLCRALISGIGAGTVSLAVPAVSVGALA
ncbi:hypothetical protein AB0L62_17930 [Nocardia asteroides]|uniref:helix-turn-helix transcriptional regulator n=1 Tax=Nocardia asteroides TaxID=1824 RepID=UPI003434A741